MQLAGSRITYEKNTDRTEPIRTITIPPSGSPFRGLFHSMRFSGKSQSFSKKAKNKEASHSVYAPPANLPASCAMYPLHNYCMRKPGKSQWFFGNPSDIYYNIILAQKKKPERRLSRLRVGASRKRTCLIGTTILCEVREKVKCFRKKAKNKEASPRIAPRQQICPLPVQCFHCILIICDFPKKVNCFKIRRCVIAPESICNTYPCT